MGLTVIHRHVCQTENFDEVREWCQRIVGRFGWGVTMEFELADSRFNSMIKPVIVIYDTVDKPIEQLKIMIALRWS